MDPKWKMAENGTGRCQRGKTMENAMAGNSRSGSGVGKERSSSKTTLPTPLGNVSHPQDFLESPHLFPIPHPPTPNPIPSSSFSTSSSSTPSCYTILASCYSMRSPALCILHFDSFATVLTPLGWIPCSERVL